jgi:hypothetical protein
MLATAVFGVVRRKKTPRLVNEKMTPRTRKTTISCRAPLDSTIRQYGSSAGDALVGEGAAANVGGGGAP